VCDVYDALCTRRPYREAWSSDQSIAYLESRVGLEFDADMVATFVRTLREGNAQVKVLTDEALSAAGRA
jgi:putative two-component system response regulator